jgi:hypothetical protein
MASATDRLNGDLSASIEEHRAELEAWAESGLPLSEDVNELLETTESNS